MAGDWIKMRTDLFTHPKVVRISSTLKADRFRTVGGLMSVWCLFDAHSIDGHLDGYDLSTVDDLIGWPGFAAAMKMVGWLDDNSEGLVLPEFDTHNGQSAKRRAQDSDRKRASRLSASDADKKRTREEKSKSSKQPPIPPRGGEAEESKKRPTIALKTFLEQCKEKGEKPILENDTVFDYASKTAIPDDFLRLHWLEFKARYCEEGSKRYKDWRSVFRKSVRGNWFKLWWIAADGACSLTTVGEQAKRAHGRDAA
ncbi:hypothetical protein [Paraburkholderia sp. SOS3]|uniref:hypothetical protein n=1 Tax=Paraburkholderia sp. SOS3 TaxID=1926494 RepID=UPI000AF7FD4A|nr:hypothetical protein [Paraburkholderia sp. SOS3]